MNIACSTTAYTRHSLEEALSGIAGQGFSHADLLMMENWAHINPSELIGEPETKARETARLLRKYALKPAAINGNLQYPLSTSDAKEIEANEASAEALLTFAKTLAVPVVVMQPGVPGDHEEISRDAAVAAFRRLTRSAERRHIDLAIETHSGSLAETYAETLDFLSRVPGLKIAYDPSHFIMTKQDLTESRILLPYTAHVHLRDAVEGNFQAPMGKGLLDFMWVLEALDTAGYTRTISIEYIDGRDAPVLADINRLKQLLDIRYAHV